jgi:high-affinity Fe2+/Pb2+ permease
VRSSRRSRIAIAVVAGLVVAAVLFGAVVAINGSRGFESCSGLLGCGWIVPLLAGLVIGGVLWLLSGESPKYDDGSESPDESATCGSCGDPVMEAWRLCPGCGSHLRE